MRLTGLAHDHEGEGIAQVKEVGITAVRGVLSAGAIAVVQKTGTGGGVAVVAISTLKTR